MISLSATSIVLLSILSATVFAQRCVPGGNCKAPKCRCWDDPKAPGGFDTPNIPQIILVSFQYGVSSANVDKYTQLLEGIVNPNKCPARATFYPTELNTQFQVVERLVAQGHEAGVSTINVTTPTTAEEWARNFSEVKGELIRAGVPKAKIGGARAPELAFGGTKQVQGMRANQLHYDSTCLNAKIGVGNYLWPYTFDFPQDIPECTAARKLNESFPGFWEFPVADLQFKGIKCAAPSGCSPLISSEQDAYDLFFNAFSQHYNQKTRPPFVMFVDPAWVSNPRHVSGTTRFLQFVGASFEDTWIVTTQQALAWIKNPVPAKKAVHFKPWGCEQ